MLDLVSEAAFAPEVRLLDLGSPFDQGLLDLGDLGSNVGFRHLGPEDRHQLIRAHGALHLLRTLAPTRAAPAGGQVGEGRQCTAAAAARGSAATGRRRTAATAWPGRPAQPPAGSDSGSRRRSSTSGETARRHLQRIAVARRRAGRPGKGPPRTGSSPAGPPATRRPRRRPRRAPAAVSFIQKAAVPSAGNSEQHAPQPAQVGHPHEAPGALGSVVGHRHRPALAADDHLLRREAREAAHAPRTGSRAGCPDQGDGR